RARDRRQAEVARLTDPAFQSLAQVEMKQYQIQIDVKSRQLRNLQAEVYARPALAMSCLAFALIGCPVGVWANRADYLSTFVICFLPTVFVYYPLLLFGSNTGKDGKLPLGLGCFLANVVVGVVGLVLTARLLRREGHRA